MKKGLLFILANTVLCMGTANAQGILDRLEKKALEKLKQNQKTEQTQTDSDDGDGAEGIDSAQMNLAMQMLGMRFNSCTPKEKYSFTIKAVIDVYSEGKRDEDSFSFRYHWLGNKTEMHTGIVLIPLSQGIETLKESKTVIDLKDSCIVTLMNTESGKMAMSMKYGEHNFSQHIKDTADQKRPVKTGKTKKINGKTCYEYVLDDKETYQQMWVESSKTALWDQNMEYWNTNVNFIKLGAKNSNLVKDGSTYGRLMDFFPLEMVSKDKKTGQVITMYTRSISKESTTISTTGYSRF